MGDCSSECRIRPASPVLRPAVMGLSLELRFPLGMSEFLTPKTLGGNLLMSGWFAAGKALKRRAANCMFIMAHPVLERRP